MPHIETDLIYFARQKGPPPNVCIATVGGKKMLKKVDEKWPTGDVCAKNICAFDTNGDAIIKELRETCNVVCQAVSWSSSVSGKRSLIVVRQTGSRAEADTGQVLRRVRENQMRRRPQAL